MSELVPAHLESSLLQEVAKFGDDFLETFLLPVYLIHKDTYRKNTQA